MSKKSNLSPVITLAKKRKAQGVVKGEKVYLESVLGLTCVNPNLLSVCGATGCIAYPAGCVTVLYYAKKNRHTYVLNTSRKHIASLCLSEDGKYLAIGECGHQPCVRVWDISSTNPSQVAELKGHNYGIACLVFSPNIKYLVSVGYQHDMAVNIWNWKTETSLASNKINFAAFGVAFSEDGSYFVIVGNRRVRYGYFDTSKDGRSSAAEPLKGRSALLGDLQDNCFVAVACGRGLLSKTTYTLTATGLLCLFNEHRVLEKYTDLKAAPAFCLSLTEQCLLCGCAGGVVRVFDPFTLDYISTLPKPHYLGVNVATVDPSQTTAQGGDAVKYPDTTALAMDSTNLRLTVVYNDHSLYIWDLRNVAQVGKCHSFLYHSSCVWDICAYPHVKQNSGPEYLPHSTFVTCSSDNTVRFWCLDPSQEGIIRNIYSKELVSMIYTTADLNCLKDGSKVPGDASAVADSTRGVRCVQFHPSGHQLAVGDRSGNLRVYSLEFMDEVVRVEAHDSDVLSIEYSPVFEDQQYLATSSRDRLIHVFTCGPTHQHLQTLDEHSASITSIKFTAHENGLQLLSCGADKSIIFRTLEKNTFTLSNHVASKGAIYDMDIDPTGKHMVTTGQDKFLRIYQVSTGKQKSVLKASTSEEGPLLKISLDPSGLYAAVVSSDKSISVFDFYSGECQAKLVGHSEMVTQVCFSVDCKYLYSVSADSCIFVWRLSDEMTKCMHDRLAELGRPVSPSLVLSPPPPSPRSLVKRKSTSSENLSIIGSEEAIDGPGGFQLSVSQLPSWARKKVIERPSIVKSISTGSLLEMATDGGTRNPLPEGRWAQRLTDDMTFAKADSDTETDDLTAEFAKVIDIEDNEDEDTSEEVIYLERSTQLEVDASSFYVTTPEKPCPKAWEDDKEADSDTEEPQVEAPPRGEEPFQDFFLGKKFGDLTVEDVDLIFGDKPSIPNSCRPSISTQYLKRTQTYQSHDRAGASPPLIPCATYIKNSTFEAPPTLPTQPTDPPTQVKADLWEGGGAPCVGQPGSSGPQTCLSSVGTTEEKRGSDVSEDRGGGGRGVEPATKAKSRKVQPTKGEFKKDLHKTKKLLEELGCNYGMDKNKSVSRQLEPDATASVKRTSISAPSLTMVQAPPPGPPTVAQAPPPGPPTVSQAPPPGPPTVAQAPPSGPPTVVQAPPPGPTARRSSRQTAAQQKSCAEVDTCQSLRSAENVVESAVTSTETDVQLSSSTKATCTSHSLLLPTLDTTADTLSTHSSLPDPQSGPSTAKVSSTSFPDVAVAVSSDLCTNAPTTDGLLQRVQSTIEKLNAEFQCLTALHHETMELLSEDTSNSTVEEAMTLMASGVSALKGQLQSMSNKYRKLWRGRDTGGCGYNLRSTPTRESSGGTPQRTRGAAKSKLEVERRALGDERREEEDEKEEQVHLTEVACTHGTQAVPSAAGTMATPTADPVATPTTDPLDPAVLQLLERFADRLVVIVEKRLQV